MREEIIQNSVYGIGEATSEEIDRLNIRRSTLLAMQRAVQNCVVGIQGPVRVIVDGNDDLTGYVDHESTAFPKADDIVPEVQAASIVAKVGRDEQMISFEQIYPAFTFSKHKGYPTAQHHGGAGCFWGYAYSQEKF